MRYPIKLENGRLLVPRRAEGPRGIIGDGIVEIGPDDPDYTAWVQMLVLDEFHNVSTSNSDQVELRRPKDGNSGNQRS
jgi:hypothetical protein